MCWTFNFQMWFIPPVLIREKNMKYQLQVLSHEVPLRSIHSQPMAPTLNCLQQFHILSSIDYLLKYHIIGKNLIFGIGKVWIITPVQAFSCCRILDSLIPLSFTIFLHTKVVHVYLTSCLLRYWLKQII